MTKSDLQNDLLADLRGAASARPLPAAPPALPPVVAPTVPATPALDVRVTPLRWSRPRLARKGFGAGLSAGPVSVSLSLGG